MKRTTVVGVAIFLLLFFAPDLFAANHSKKQLKAVCGEIAGINAPIDVHAKPTMLGIVMRAPKTYPPTTSPKDYFLGVSRTNPNAPGLLAVLSATYVAKNKVLVVYDEKDLFVYCVQAQEKKGEGHQNDECPEVYSTYCIGSPTPKK